MTAHQAEPYHPSSKTRGVQCGGLLRPQGRATSPFRTWFFGYYLVLPRQGIQGRPLVPSTPETGPVLFAGLPGRAVSPGLGPGTRSCPPQHTVFPGQDCRTLRPRDVDVSQLRLQGRAGCLPRHTPHPAPHTATSSETGPHSLTRALLKAAFFSWVLDMRPCHM